MTMEGDDASAYITRGNARLANREWADAIACFTEGLERHADDVDLRVGLGAGRLALGQLHDALKEFLAAISTSPRHVGALRYLAVSFELLSRKEDASQAWSRLGSALQARQQFEQARDAYRQALTHDGKSLHALVELGAVLLRLGEPREALGSLEAAKALAPDNGGTHILLSRAYHLLGDCTRGLEEFAWLTEPRTVQWRAFEQPLWDGSPLDGQTIMVWVRPRSGLGDAIQFLRYAPLVKARGATVIVECHPELVPVAARMPGVDVAVASGGPLPRFDVHIPLPRLPTLLKNVPWPLPMSAPYVIVGSGLVERWRQHLGSDGRLKVGLAWAGAPGRPDSSIRFAPLTAFAPLGRLSHVHLISLQVEPQAAEAASPPEGLRLTRVPIALHTPLEETAALILNLDLVLSVDTMLAHLAGAVGRPVWTLLPYAADWRWLCGDTTSWYPTMRLFRQTTRGDWNGLLAHVARALEV